MKFNKQQRRLHEDTYNPPCNYYNPTLHQQIIKSIQMRETNTFGLQTRLDNSSTVTPGPGAYQQHKNLIINYGKQVPKNGIVPMKKNIEVQNHPSIPSNFWTSSLAQEDQQYIKQLHLKEDLNKSTMKTKRKEPSFSFSKKSSDRKQLQSSKDKSNQYLATIAEKQQQIRVLNEQNKNMNVKKQNDRKKAILDRRNYIMNLLNPEFVPSLEMIDLMKKHKDQYIPGPGSYTITNDEIKGMSFAQMKRFKYIDKNSIIEPGFYNTSVQKKRKNVICSQANRNLSNEVATDLLHRFYIDPNPKPIKRSQSLNCNPFGSGALRFTEKNMKQQPQISYQQKKMTRRANQIRVKLQKKISQSTMPTSKDEENEGLLGLSSMIFNIE